MVSPVNDGKFLETLAESKREGKEVERVIVDGGTPSVYEMSD
ncbi:hypothetical protein [Pseudoclavibacter helvolus]|nr:hypothetical protein [Pseudoclavibacter helvolus]